MLLPDSQWELSSRLIHLLLGDLAKMRGDDGVFDNDVNCWHDAVVVEGTSGGIVAEVGSEPMPHCGWPNGAAFQFEEERPRLLAVPVHEEGIGMDGSRTVLVLEVACGAVGRVQLGDFPTLTPGRRYR